MQHWDVTYMKEEQTDAQSNVNENQTGLTEEQKQEVQPMDYPTAKTIAITQDDCLSTGESLLIVAALCTLAASLMTFSLL